MSSPLSPPPPSPPQCIQGFYYSDLELVSYTILKMKKNGIWVTLYQILDQNVTIRQTTWSRELYHESSDCAEYPKESLLKSSYPKKYLPKFSNLVPRAFHLKNGRGGHFLREKPWGRGWKFSYLKKSRNRKFQTQNILRPSLSLEIRNTPPPSPGLCRSAVFLSPNFNSERYFLTIGTG